MSTGISKSPDSDIGGSCTELSSLKLMTANYRSALHKPRGRLCYGRENCFRPPAITAKRQRLWTTRCMLCTPYEAITKIWG